MNGTLVEQADLSKMRSYKKYGVEFGQLIDVIKCRDTRWRFRLLLYRTLISNIVLCSKQTWTRSQKAINIVGLFERKILGPTQDNGVWRFRHKEEIHVFCVDVALSTFLQPKTTVGWTRSKDERSSYPPKILVGFCNVSPCIFSFH